MRPTGLTVMSELHSKIVCLVKRQCVHFVIGTAFVHHNMDKLSRIYPAGSRTDSSNYNPVPMWNAGCQIGTLQYTTYNKSVISY